MNQPHHAHHSELFPRVGGVLLHPTSLPSIYGIGDFGRGARIFLDWLAQSGLSRWQVLPLVPPGPGNSPYSTPSALAGNTMLIDLEGLRDDGLLDDTDLRSPGFSLDKVEYERVIAFKAPLIKKAAVRLAKERSHRLHDKFTELRDREGWAREYALFTVLREKLDRPWWEWPSPLIAREKKSLAEARAENSREIEAVLAAQVLFDDQWTKVRKYAEERAIQIIGDVPLYVDHDSVDVWANRELFQLDSRGNPTNVAGAPPDFFTELGQLWGNPLYDWTKIKATGYKWWISRMERLFQLTHIVRIDHFRGFSAFWSVPASDPDARHGVWEKGPGAEFFAAVENAIGKKPIVLEDLGVIDDPVVALREATGFPGMRILQYAWGEDAGHAYLPHSYPQNCVVYTSTHDTDTTLGWWRSAPEHIRDHVRRYLAVSGNDIVWDVIRLAFGSVAHTAIVPLQDVLSLDSGTRMNIPGQPQGQWSWRVRQEAFNPSTYGRLLNYARLYDRDEAVRQRLRDARRAQAELQALREKEEQAAAAEAKAHASKKAAKQAAKAAADSAKHPATAKHETPSVAKPADAQKPVESHKHAEPHKPADAPKHSEPVKHAEPVKPNDAAKPVETPKPAEPPKPVAQHSSAHVAVVAAPVAEPAKAPVAAAVEPAAATPTDGHDGGKKRSRSHKKK